MSNDYEQATAAPGEVRIRPLPNPLPVLSEQEPSVPCPVCGCRLKLVPRDA